VATGDLRPSGVFCICRQREHARYGAAHDSSTGNTPTLTNHTRWLAKFTNPVLELRTNLTVVARVAAMLAELRRHLFG
jgi:hypothetical protein